MRTMFIRETKTNSLLSGYHGVHRWWSSGSVAVKFKENDALDKWDGLLVFCACGHLFKGTSE